MHEKELFSAEFDSNQNGVHVEMQNKHFTCVGKGHGAPVVPATREDWEKMRRDKNLAQLCETIKQGDKEAKHRLPVWTPHCAQFNNNHRSIADAVKPLRRLMLDFDEKGHTDIIMRKMGISPGEVKPDVCKPLITLMIEESVSGGTHVLVEMPENMSIEETQQLMYEITGFEPDKAVKDVARCIYMVPEDHTRYVNPRMFEVEEGCENECKTALVNTELNSQPSDDVLCYKGIPYSKIIDEYWPKMGGVPKDGDRNVKLHQLAVHLRAICDNNKEVLMKVMPRYGLEESEFRSIIDSACKEQPKGISKIIKAIVNLLTAERELAETAGDEMFAEPTRQYPVINPKTLPIGLKETLVGVPTSMHMPVLCSVLPLAGAYADQVEAEYCDGNMHHMGLMSAVLGEQASNKSVCAKAIDVWLRPLEEEDALARKREDEWKERKKNRKANEKAPDDPHVVIRKVPLTISCSTLLKRFKNAQGHTLYSFGEEMDTLTKTNSAGSWSAKYDVYRVSFDRGQWGQDYNSDQAESGVVEANYNFTVLGTKGAFYKCFKSDNVENGLSSRMLVAEMPDAAFAKLTKFGKRTPEEEAQIQEAVKILRSAHGVVNVSRLSKAMEAWVEEKRLEAIRDIDRVKDTYRKRSAVIGFRCGVIYHILSRKSKVTKQCIDFAIAIAEYCLAHQMDVFGHLLKEQFAQAVEVVKRKRCNNTVFDKLPEIFTMSDVRIAKGENYAEPTYRGVVHRWKNEKMVIELEDGRWQKAIKAI